MPASILSRTVSPDRRSHNLAQTPDREARTRPARTAFPARFEYQIEPDGVLAPPERQLRAESAKRAYFQRLALKSSLLRRNRSSR